MLAPADVKALKAPATIGCTTAAPKHVVMTHPKQDAEEGTKIMAGMDYEHHVSISDPEGFTAFVMFHETPHVHGFFLSFSVGSATTRGDCESQSCRCPPAMQSHWLRMVFLHRHFLFSRDIVTCLCGLCVFVVKDGEDKKTFVSSLNLERTRH